MLTYVSGAIMLPEDCETTNIELSLWILLLIIQNVTWVETKYVTWVKTYHLGKNM